MSHQDGGHVAHVSASMPPCQASLGPVPLIEPQAPVNRDRGDHLSEGDGVLNHGRRLRRVF
jgi:hypothetical protein